MIAGLIGLVAAAAVFGLAAPAVARSAPPTLALWTLGVGGLAIAAATWAALGAVLLVAAGRLAAVAHVGGWSARGIAAHSPIPGPVAAACGVGLLAVVGATVVAGHGQLRRLRAAWAVSRTSPSLVVLDGDGFEALAVPGRPGCVVVSRRLLAALDADGRHALLAHEHAHLREHHELHLVVGAVAAAANPLLRPLPAAVRTSCERRADEVAARLTGDRALVADTITRVSAPSLGGVVLGGAGADVPRRVSALLHPRPVRPAAVLPVLLVAASYASLLWLGHGLDAVLDASHLIGAHR